MEMSLPSSIPWGKEAGFSGEIIMFSGLIPTITLPVYCPV
jgi:hypothetical protein